MLVVWMHCWATLKACSWVVGVDIRMVWKVKGHSFHSTATVCFHVGLPKRILGESLIHKTCIPGAYTRTAREQPPEQKQPVKALAA